VAMSVEVRRLNKILNTWHKIEIFTDYLCVSYFIPMEDHKEVIKREFGKQASVWQHREKTHDQIFMSNVEWINSELDPLFKENPSIQVRYWKWIWNYIHILYCRH
jgi:hypothetical protein